MPPIHSFDGLAKAFHWGVAGLLLLQVPLAFYMVDQPLGPAKLGNYATHKSLGLLIFAVTALRLAWRVVHPAPSLPAGTAAWQKSLARVNQFLLYALLFLMPVTGLLRSQAANFPVNVFGLFTVPTLVAPDDQFSRGMAAAHEAQGSLLLVLVAAHAAAALHHHFVRRDGVLAAMLPAALARRVSP